MSQSIQAPTRAASKANFSAELHSIQIPTYSDGKFYIYWSSWDWGRDSQNCGSNGICDYEDCWMCDRRPSKPYRGQVIFDRMTKEGYIIVELDTLEPVQINAIKNKESFFVDSNIEGLNSVLRAGVYPFDSSIGAYGGYKVNITLK